MNGRPVDSSPEGLLNERIRADADSLLLQFLESCRQERAIFIQHATDIFSSAIGKDINQQANIESLPSDVFKHYYLFYFAEELTAKEGEVYKSTIGIKLAQYVDEHGRPEGEEIQLRVIIPEDFIISKDTDPAEISAWLDSVSEVYVCNKVESKDSHKTVIFRILAEGFQFYSPLEDDSKIDIDQELQSFISAAPDISALAKSALDDASSIYELLVKLGTYKLVPQRYTELKKSPLF